MIATAYRHIELDNKGVALVKGTTTRVIDLVLLRMAYNWAADEIQRQQPHLTLAEIHSALAYYYDHQEELDRDIRARRRAADAFFDCLGYSPFRAKLLAARHAQR